MNLGFKKTASQSTAVIIFELKDSDLLTEILLDLRCKQQIEVELTEKEKAELRKRQKQGIDILMY